MCARWQTIAMSKLLFGFERSFCRCMAVMSCALGWCVCDLTCFQVMWLVVLRQYYNVLLQHYSSTTLYYKVLRQYYNVLPSITTYYSSTLYCKVLRQYYYYSRLQSTTPYYKVLLQYYKVSMIHCSPLEQKNYHKVKKGAVLCYKQSVLNSSTSFLGCIM